jgi:hypothetical protein
VQRIFLLSPAHCGGQRARLLYNERAQFDLARRLRLQTVPLGEVFSFLSGLCFRGKLSITGAVRHGKLPEKLIPRRYT